MKKHVAVNFTGGFGLAENANQVIEAAKYGAHLKIRDFDSRAEAYWFACSEHVGRELKNSPDRMIYIPTLENMFARPIFYPADFVPCYIAPRLFAAINENFVAILDDIPSLIDFMQNVEHFDIHETYSTLEAQRFIENSFYKIILTFISYIDVPIPRCPQIPRNTIVQLPFKDWIQENIVKKFKNSEFFPQNLLLLNSSN